MQSQTPDPLTVSPYVAESAASTRTEAEARAERRSPLLVLAGFAERQVPSKGHTEGTWKDSVIGCAARAGIFPGLTLSEIDHIPLYEGECCYIALSLLFKISVKDAKFLFSHAAYQHKFPTPSDVAGRIRRFLDMPVID
jgi:hypothetical protein